MGLEKSLAGVLVDQSDVTPFNVYSREILDRNNYIDKLYNNFKGESTAYLAFRLSKYEIRYALASFEKVPKPLMMNNKYEALIKNLKKALELIEKKEKHDAENLQQIAQRFVEKFC